MNKLKNFYKIYKPENILYISIYNRFNGVFK